MAVVALLAMLLAPLAAAGAGRFTDDDASIHEPDIEAIANEGITRGCNPPTNTLYCPDRSVTRGEMAAFLTRALSLPNIAAADHFTDDDQSEFEGDIERLATAQITVGCNPPANDWFCPEDSVSRAQMASFLTRALSLPASTSSRFVDTRGSIHSGDIDALAQAGITLGCDPPANDRFCPDDSVSRAQMASFLTRALDLTPLHPPTGGDPGWYTTPEPQGLGTRIVTVPTSGSPSLDQALAGARPGDVIELASGIHRNTGGNVALDVSGTPDQWIAIRGVAGSRPIIDLEGAGELRVSGSNVLVEHLEIVDGGGNNLHVSPGGSSIGTVVIRDVSIHDLRSGPGAAIKINRNNGMSSGVSSIYIEDADLSGAISNAVVDGVGVSRAVVRNSVIHDNAIGSHGIFFKGGSSEILIENNLIHGIRQNAAVQLGGNTGPGFFDPAHADQEGVDQLVRNNLIADFDDSAVEIRGVSGGRVHHNTIVTQSDFAIFRLSCGNTDGGGVSTNAGIDVVNNSIIGTGENPQYARNDCGPVDVTFGPQGWFGMFHNSGSATPGIPAFPTRADTAVFSPSGVVNSFSTSGLTTLPAAIERYRPIDSGPAIGAGASDMEVVPTDLTGAARPQSPTL